ILLATVLHVVVLSAYFILGSSKKMSAPTAATKTAEGDAAKPGPVTPPKEGAPATGDKTTAKTPGPDDKKPGKPPEEIRKSSEVAKPGEIPTKPDSDIDEILKRK